MGMGLTATGRQLAKSQRDKKARGKEKRKKSSGQDKHHGEHCKQRSWRDSRALKGLLVLVVLLALVIVAIGYAAVSGPKPGQRKGLCHYEANLTEWYQRYQSTAAEATEAIATLIRTTAGFRQQPRVLAFVSQDAQLASQTAQDFARAAFPLSGQCVGHIAWQDATLQADVVRQLALAPNSLLLFQVAAGDGTTFWTSAQETFFKTTLDTLRSLPHGRGLVSSAEASFLFYGPIAEPVQSIHTLRQYWIASGRPDIPTLFSHTFFVEPPSAPDQKITIREVHRDAVYEERQRRVF